MQDTPVPFFARFLEGQDYPEVQSDVKAGVSNPGIDVAHTMKYPSDGDDNPPKL